MNSWKKNFICKKISVKGWEKPMACIGNLKNSKLQHNPAKFCQLQIEITEP